jgi:hypothetical protein
MGQVTRVGKREKFYFPRKPEWLGSNLRLEGHTEIGFGEMGCEHRNYIVLRTRFIT